MTSEQFKHRLMVKLSDGTVEILHEGSLDGAVAAKYQLCKGDSRFLNGFNINHVIKFWVETPEQQQEAQERLLEAARHGMVVVDD